MAIEYELVYQPQGKTLEAFHHCDAPRQFIRGPLGSGKTIGVINKIFDLICEIPPCPDNVRRSRWAGIRNSYSELFTTTIKDWREVFGDELGVFKQGGKEPPNHQLRFDLDDGTSVEAEMYFIAQDKPQHVKKLRGLQLTGAWLNEAKELPFAVVQMAFGRCGRYPRRSDVEGYWYGIIGDTNSPDEDHWYYELAEETKPDGWAFFTQPGGVIRKDEKWIPNPLAENLDNLPPGYYETQLAGAKYDWIKVNLANEYGSVLDGVPIYQHDWNDALHVADVGPVPDVELICGWDFGLTPALIIGQLTPRGQLRLLEEIIGSNIGVRQFAEGFVKPVLSTKYRGFKIRHVGDPAGNRRAETDETTVFQELEKVGIKIEAAPSNEALRRWEAVRWWLGQLRDGKPAMVVNTVCKVVRKGFNGGYRYKQSTVNGEKRASEEADKNRFSHPHDAVQYICLTLREENEAPKREPLNTLPPRSNEIYSGRSQGGGWMR